MINNQVIKSFSLLILTSLMLAVTSCKKDDAETDELITDAEAAEMVEATVSERSAGASMTFEESAQSYETAASICGSAYDTSFQVSYQFGQWTYNKQTTLAWNIVCVNFVPQSANFSMDGNSSFTTPRWNGVMATDGSYTLSGLQPGAPNYTLAGSYHAEGQMSGNLRNRDPQLNSIIDLNLTNIGIDKDSYDITGGSGAVSITVTNGSGQSRTVNGSIVFHGNGTATVTVNGYAYTFDL